MAFTADGTIVPYPMHPTDISAAPTISSTTYRLNSATDYVYAVFTAQRAMSINKVKFRTGTQTTGCVIAVHIETISSGIAGTTASDWATNTNGTIGGTSTANTEYEVTLTANASITKGQKFAVVLRVSSGTPSLLNINAFVDSGLPYEPYLVEYDGSTSVIANTAPMYAISDATDGYINILGSFPASAFTTHTITSGTTPDVLGNKITLNTPKIIKGFWVWADVDQTATVRLLSSDGSTVLASQSLDVNEPPLATAGLHWVMFTSDVEAGIGDYYLTFEPDSTSNFTVYSQDVSDTKYLPACIGSGDSVYVSAKNPTNAASYTVSTTSVLLAGLLIDGGDNGVSAGGGGSYSFMS